MKHGLDGDADRRVETPSEQIAHRVAQMQIDRYLRESGKELP